MDRPRPHCDRGWKTILSQVYLHCIITFFNCMRAVTLLQNLISQTPNTNSFHLFVYCPRLGSELCETRNSTEFILSCPPRLHMHGAIPLAETKTGRTQDCTCTWTHGMPHQYKTNSVTVSPQTDTDTHTHTHTHTHTTKCKIKVAWVFPSCYRTNIKQNKIKWMQWKVNVKQNG